MSDQLNANSHFAEQAQDEHQKIVDLCGDFSQKDVAIRLGVSRATVSRHLRLQHNRADRRGKKPKKTEEMMYAAARFMFIYKQSTWDLATKFLKRTYGVSLLPKTVCKHVKNKCGFRHGDFRCYPTGRNSDEAIEKRYIYATEIPQKYSPVTLYDAIYYDEMFLTTNTKTGAWTLIGWTPTVGDETPHESNGPHISLLLAASPSLGVVYWEIISGSVTGNTVTAFCEAMVTAYVTKFPTARSVKRALFMDNVKTHHDKKLVAYLTGDVVSMVLGLEYLPPYSPFLNPLGEVFADIKRQIWMLKVRDIVTDESLALMKKRLTDVLQGVNSALIMKYYEHMIEFLHYSRERTPVFTQKPHEDSHIGDEVGMCMELPTHIERLLDSYLPHVFDEFTPENQWLVESYFYTARLTQDFLDGVINEALRQRVDLRKEFENGMQVNRGSSIVSGNNSTSE